MKAKSPQQIRYLANRTLIWVVFIFLMTFIALGGILRVDPQFALPALGAAFAILFWLLIRTLHLASRFWKADHLERLYQRDVNYIQTFAREAVRRKTGEYEMPAFTDELGIFDAAPIMGAKSR